MWFLFYILRKIFFLNVMHFWYFEEIFQIFLCIFHNLLLSRINYFITFTILRKMKLLVEIFTGQIVTEVLVDIILSLILWKNFVYLFHIFILVNIFLNTFYGGLFEIFKTFKIFSMTCFAILRYQNSVLSITIIII